jgi:hypothetical protein
VYSGLLLTESGLFSDAIICERSALETVAFHWLICLDPNAAIEYETDQAIQPVKVRLRLEKLGADVSQIRELYSLASGLTHVGRDSERFNNQLESEFKGVISFGGRASQIDQEHMFKYLPALLYLFQKPLMAGTAPA